MKKELLDAAEFIEFLKTAEITYAFEGDKKLTASVLSTYRIYQKGVKVRETQNPQTAIDFYNEL